MQKPLNSSLSPTLRNLTFLCLVFLTSLTLKGQEQTVVRGKVFDAKTKLPLPFVDVTFKGTYVGASTDLDGQYKIKTKNPSDTLMASFVGYSTQIKIVSQEDRQRIDFYLEEEGIIGDEVTIIGKKQRYKKKDNPAVELIKKVSENKDRNRIESQDYYNYDKHEKIEIDLNNITEEFKQRKQFKNFKFLWNYLDTSNVNGRVFLPLFMREILSTVHFQKDPKIEKERREAVKMTKFDEAIDMHTITGAIDLLYDEVDIYQNSIRILDNDFLSPLAPWGTNYYRYYIIDTTSVNNQSAIHMSFIPRNKTFIGFTGDLYISNDDKYTVLKAVLGVTKDISLNFVRDIKVVQEFEEAEDVFRKKRDELTLDIAIAEGGLGIYAKRTNTFDNFNFDPPDPEKLSGVGSMIEAKDAYKKDDTYWNLNRIEALSTKEEGIYKMIDTLVTVPTYKRFVLATKIVATGYIPAGHIDIGDLGAFVSRNDVEGWRFRFGGETSHAHSSKYRLEGYGAYGLRDKNFKYQGAFTYSFTDDWRENPKNLLTASYTHDVIFPGLQLEFLEADNFLTSIRRGRANQMMLMDRYSLDYFNDTDFGFYKIGLENINRLAYDGGAGGEGTLSFENGLGQSIPDVQTMELNVSAEYSPNATFLQGRRKRVPVVDNVPRLQISYKGAIKGLLGGDYSYHKLALILKKRIPLSIAGRSLTDLEIGRVWAGDDLPYILLYIPRANQSYSFQPYSFNTMNFLEFTTNKYLRFSWQHFFDGYLINRIPLIRKLNLKEIFHAKLVWGSLSDRLNPALNEELIQYSNNENGESLTYPLLSNKPYFEYGIGIYNILRFLRFDLVKRANYLDHPNVENLWGVKGLGMRVRMKVEF